MWTVVFVRSVLRRWWPWICGIVVAVLIMASCCQEHHEEQEDDDTNNPSSSLNCIFREDP